MAFLNENSLLYAPRDWVKGWGILADRRIERIRELQQALIQAETDPTIMVSQRDLERVRREEPIEMAFDTMRGIGVPIVGIEIGSIVGLEIGLLIDRLPIHMGTTIQLSLGVMGAGVGLLEGLAHTRQAKAGKQERLRRSH